MSIISEALDTDKNPSQSIPEICCLKSEKRKQKIQKWDQFLRKMNYPTFNLEETQNSIKIEMQKSNAKSCVLQHQKSTDIKFYAGHLENCTLVLAELKIDPENPKVQFISETTCNVHNNINSLVETYDLESESHLNSCVTNIEPRHTNSINKILFYR